MNMRDYSSLHLDTINSSKGTVLLLLFYISQSQYIWFILQSVHLLYKYAIRIHFCFIRTRRINFSAYE